MERRYLLGSRLGKFFKSKKDKSRNATPTPSRATTPDPTPVATSAAGNRPLLDIGDTILDTFDTTLKVLKEASAPFPPLQAAVGGICECIKIYKSVSGNTEQLQSLVKDLTSRTESLEPYLSPENLGSSNQAVQILIDHLEAIGREVKQQQNSGLFQKTARSEYITEKIQVFKTKIQGAYEKCKIEVLFSAERNTAAILKEVALGQMKHSTQAYHDADMGLNFTRRLCCTGTRKAILADIEKWATSSEPDNMSSAYWIWGMAGTGKSTIAMSICDKLKENKVLAGTFFCSRQIPECRDYRLIIPTLAYQLASFSQTFAMSLKSILSENLDPASKKPDHQVKALLIEPWKAVAKSGNMAAQTPLIVIDALDECEGVSLVLKPLIYAIQEKEFPGLKFLFTSRPEQAIMLSESQMNANSIIKVGKIILHEVEKSQVQDDIMTYVTHELDGISSSMEQLQKLTKLSGALFIYASTVVKFVKEGDIASWQKKRLKDFLEKSENPEDLAQLYVEVIENGIPKKRSSGEAEEHWNIMYAIITVGCPVTCDIIAKLLSIETDVVTHLIEKLQAVFYISRQDDCIFSFHASFPQFIERVEGIGGAAYQPKAQHLKLVDGCFNIMEQLRFNICNLPSSFILDKEVPKFDERVEECIGEALGYCCRFWSYHFIHCEMCEKDVERLERFLKAKGIYWIEAMSLLGLLSQCGEALYSMLKKLLYFETASKARPIIRYLQNILLQFSSGEVQGRTPHLYLSIMPFWSNSLGCMPKLMKGLGIKSLAQNGPNDVVILRGHDNGVRSVAFSPDGTRIVSGSHDKTVRIWDVTTGAQIGDTLHGHDNEVNSVAFSPDGTRIVSGSYDNTVRIWDATTGAQIGDTLHGHDNGVNSVAFSPDGTRIVSVLGDYTVIDNTLHILDTISDPPIPDDHYNLQSFQAHHNWTLSHNGWIKFPDSSHDLIWIPPQFRKFLWRSQNTCIISRKGYTKLSFEDCIYGENWIHCIGPEGLPSKDL